MRVFLVLCLLPLTSLAGDFLPEPEPTSIVTVANSYSQSDSKSSANSGAASNVLTIEDRLQIPYTPPPTAPSIAPTAPCVLGSSDAVTLPVFGKSKGRTVIDPGCEFRELVRLTLAVDPCLARKLLQTNEAIKAIEPNAVVTCTPPVPRETVTKDYVDKQVQGAKEEAKARTDTAFRQSQGK